MNCDLKCDVYRGLASAPSNFKLGKMSSTQPPKSYTASSAVASSSPHLLKQLTAGIMTVSASNPVSQDEAVPPCKKLKLDMEAATTANSSSTTTTTNNSKGIRQRLLDKRRARRSKVLESYKDNMSELFFLQSNGNVVDLPTFRKKPSHKYLNFLKSNNVPSDVMDEMRLAVLGPNAISEKPQVTVSTTTGKVTVSSAAMAAAVVAAHGSNWRPVNSTANSESLKATPPYSPRSSLLSPVKYGDQLQPFNRQNSTRSTYAEYRIPSYSKELLVEKLRQEAWVTRRINDLTREGLWSDKRLPKVCERPRPRTHWDSVLSEMKWMSVDFHEEKRWKLAAAKMLAYSAKIYVEQQADRRARAQLAEERRHRLIAKFCAEQIDHFWQSIFQIHTEKIPDNFEATTKSTTELGEASSESGVCNLDEDSEEEIEDEEYYCETFFYHDDESTIAEQEAFEAEQEPILDEILVLQGDNEQKIQDVLTSVYPGYDLKNDIDYQVQHDSSLSSAEDEDSEEDFDSDDDDLEDSDSEFTFMNSDTEEVINLALARPQRKLYDDYLSSSQSVLESLDAQSIANVLQTLRKICNHPQLLENFSESQVPEVDSVNFPRILDGVRIPSRVSTALDYDPYADIDLKSLNLVFFAHESTLTAITSDRIRKCCAPKILLEELSSHNHTAPQVPLYNFNWNPDGQHSLDTTAKVQLKKVPENGTTAFHKDSLNVIAKFNERRCHGMPLYGQDLIEALTIDLSAPLRPTSIWKGSGFSRHLNLDTLESNTASPNHFWPFLAPKTGGIKKHASKYLRGRMMKNLTLLPTANLNIHSDLVTLPPKVELVAGFNRTHLALTSKHLAIEEAVKWARSKQKQPKIYKNAFKNSMQRRRLRDLSSKLAKLDGLLQTFRNVNERTLVFCEMPEMLDLLKLYFQIHHIPFLYLDPNVSHKQKLNVLEEFSTRGHFLAMLTSPKVISQQQLVPARKFSGFTNICNVVFFDSNLNSTVDQAETLDWCRSFNGLASLNVFKLVCEDTVEDSLSIRALHQKLAMNNHKLEPEPNDHNGLPICKIKKHAIDALFNLGGGNGILTTTPTVS